MIAQLPKWLGAGLLWLIVLALLTIIYAPAFLDRIYYEGPVSDHYDGQRFENPDGGIEFPVPPGEQRGNLFYRFLFGRQDRPDWPEQVAVKRTKPPVRVEGMEMRATWIGHATVLIQTAGLNILTDPIWSDYASPFPGVGPKRVAQPGVAFDNLPKIDIVIVSHDHYDHMDLPTLKRLWRRDRPLIVTSLGNDAILRSAGIEARALDWGATVQARGAAIHVLRNHHWSSRWGRDRNRALWSAFLIETKSGNIFFAGDTGKGDGRWPLAALKYGPVRLALIPIGAFRFYPGQNWSGAHIGPEQAAELYDQLAPAMAIPIHWGTFRLSNEAYRTPPDMLAIYMRCRGTGLSPFRDHAIGEQIDVPRASFRTGPVSAQALKDCAPGSAALAALK